MTEIINKLHKYLQENNPDLLVQLEEDGQLTTYLNDKLKNAAEVIKDYTDQPDYINEEACMGVLTQDLRPSKFNYIRNVLEEEFEKDYQQFLTSGTLPFEVINLIAQCQPVFEEIGFTAENEDSNDLRNAVTGSISEYLEKREQ